MPFIDEEILTAKGKRLAIVVARFNHHITDALLADALETVTKLDGDAESVMVAHVAGAFEIPLVAKRLADSGKYDGVLCLGCVIRGGTPHFDYVCNGVTDGVMQTMLTTGVPMGFGVLTTDTLQQAAERAAGKEGAKGREAMLALIETIQVLKKI